MNYRINIVVKKTSPFRGYGSMSDAVRDVLNSCRNPQDFNLTYVSEQLFMSPRTVSRKLHNEGAKFQSILDQERKNLCRELILHGIDDALDLVTNLGFSDASHFYKKFPVWFGVSFCEFKADNKEMQASVFR